MRVDACTMRVDACTMRVVHIVFASYSIFVAQRIGDALAVEIDEGVMHGLVERGDVCEGPVGE